ncbi:MAG: hypothetical protein R2698_00495 [Microthrixaceae bacterium]
MAEERAAQQERQRTLRRERDERLVEHFAGGSTGEAFVRVNGVATAVFAVATLLGAVVDHRWSRLGAAVVDLVLFAGGLVAFGVALLVGARRSRTADMTMAGWWFLDGSAPARVRRIMLGCIAAQTAIGLAGAAARPFTAMAFGVLVPTLGLGLTGCWGARFGMFGSR